MTFQESNWAKKKLFLNDFASFLPVAPNKQQGS